MEKKPTAANASRPHPLAELELDWPIAASKSTDCTQKRSSSYYSWIIFARPRRTQNHPGRKGAMKLLIPLSQNGFDWAWKTSVCASLLIVLVFLLQKLLARWLTPSLRYALSLLVLIRLLLPIAPASSLSFENILPRQVRLAKPVAALPISPSGRRKREHCAVESRRQGPDPLPSAHARIPLTTSPLTSVRR